MATITGYEREQIDKANASGRTPAVFIHGLWLLPSSWDNWTAAFEEAGYAAIAVVWPGDPGTVEEAPANALSDEETERLYETHHVAAPGVALMQMANANLNPFTEAKACGNRLYAV